MDNFIVVPANPGIWTAEAYISQSKRRYDDLEKAKKAAYDLSKQYNDSLWLVLTVNCTVKSAMEVK